MPKRFEPNRRLLSLLVGSNLYGGPDACIRELIQNSWDAIQLRQTTGDGQGGAIEVAYSERDRWFEVTDDGIGMNLETIENSFLEIGQDKIDVLKRGSRETQIGYFGIGILSIFLVADRFEVGTKELDSQGSGVRFQIDDLDAEMKFIDKPYALVGTKIRVFLRSDSSFSISAIPDYLSTYARHVSGIEIHSIDEERRTNLHHTWVTDGQKNVHEIADVPGVIASRFTFSPALRTNTGTLSSEITICNAGFLTEKEAHDLIPLSAIGLIGEIDIFPNTLTMGMSRERIQRDEKWTELGSKLQDVFVRLAILELTEGGLQANSDMDIQEFRRNILVWYNFIPSADPFLRLREILESLVFSVVPFSVSERSSTTLSHLLENDKNSEKMFFRDISRGGQRTESIDDEGLPIRVSQEIRDSVRVSALRANGYDVVELTSIPVNVRNGTSVQTIHVQEVDLVRQCLSDHGVPLVNIIDATETDMDLKSIERLPILNDALSIGGRLRFARIPDSTRRVIADSTGVKYVNLRNEDVQEILDAIPEAVSNPLRIRLLEAYLQLEIFQFHTARKMLKELLLTEELAVLANAETAPFTKRHMEELVRALGAELKQ